MRDRAARLVRALKYAGWTDLARPMGAAMAPPARRLAGDSARPRLVPVPLTAARLRRRGFNQAELLARRLGTELEWEVVASLERAGRARRQAGLGRASRRENVRGGFRATPPGEDGATALVVDDVVTTGSTAGACAAALRRVGWRPLGVVSFARALSASPVDGPEEEEGTGRRG